MEIKKKVWLIMDKKHMVVAKGVPRNRRLELLSNEKSRQRILTYDSQKKAISGFRDSWFYTGLGVDEYFEKEYGCEIMSSESRIKLMEAVEAILTFEI